MSQYFKLFVFSITLLLNEEVKAQNHVKWETRFDAKTSEIVITALIDKGWYLYSIHNAEELGPVPTHINFKKKKGLKVKGNLTEQASIVAFDPNFGTNLGYHENKVEFRQKVKIRKLTSIDIQVFYMVCNDSQCLPPLEIVLPLKLK